MTDYIGFEDIVDVLSDDQLHYFNIVFAAIYRKLSRSEFLEGIRSMETGMNAAAFVERLASPSQTLH